MKNRTTAVDFVSGAEFRLVNDTGGITIDGLLPDQPGVFMLMTGKLGVAFVGSSPVSLRSHIGSFLKPNTRDKRRLAALIRETLESDDWVHILTHCTES
jgi:hypothetical protein